MIKTSSILVLVLCMLMMNTGCWNNRDLTEMAILTALGIDRTEDGKIMISIQIVKPSDAKTSGKEGGGGGSGSKSFVVISNSADTIFGALSEMLDRVNQKIFYGSAQVIVIGEEVARENIDDVVDFLLRDHESQHKTDVVVAKGITAKEVLEQEFDLTKIPGAYISDTLKNTEERGMVKRTMLIEVVKEMSSEQTQLAIGTILKEAGTTASKGVAVFKEKKMVGTLDDIETRGYMFVADKVKSTILELPSPVSAGDYVGIEIIRSKSKIDLQWKNGKPSFVVKIEPEGNIGEQQSDESMKELEYLKKLMPMCNEKIESEAMSAITKCREKYKSDIFGFGETLYKKDPGYWSKVQQSWNEEGFPGAEIRVEVDTKLYRSGLLREPIESR